MTDVETLPPRAATVFSRLAETIPGVRIESGSPSGFHSFGELSPSEALAEFSAQLRGRFGAAPRSHVAALAAAGRYAYLAGLVIAVPYHLTGRGPVIQPGGVRVSPAGDAVAVTPAGGSGWRPERPGECRAACAAELRPLFAVLGPFTRRGPAALWALGADQLAAAFWHAGTALGMAGSAARLANAVLPGGTPPLAGAAGFRLDGAHPPRTRLTCCLQYTVPGAELCGTCPRRVL